MLAAITIWVKNIILIVLFASFMELLLPNTSMKRFIRVIMGIFIMLAILNPLLHFFETEKAGEHVAALSRDNMHNTKTDTITKVLDSTATKREELINTAYTQDLTRQITAVVKSIGGVDDAIVKVNVNNETNTIRSIIVYVKPSDNTYSKNNIKIDSIVIGKKIRSQEIQEGLTEKVRQTVSELYQLPQKDIDIELLS